MAIKRKNGIDRLREVVVALLAWRVALCVVTSCSAAPPGPWRNGPRTADLDLVNHEFAATNPSRGKIELYFAATRARYVGCRASEGGLGWLPYAT